MSKAQSQHPTPERLAAFVQGRLPAAEQAELERHVAECASCCQALAAVPDDTLLSHLRAATAPLDATKPHAKTGEADVPLELREHARYRVVKLLGKGGMGEVYLAEHRLMERPVALKVIHRAIMQDPQAVERFRNEVKAAARLAHPNIVAAHDADHAGDVHFLVMEYIEGVNLAHHVERHGAMPVPLACDCARQTALGLQHAFEQGMIHRDIKPQNLMLTAKGVVKIFDFGLARFAREEGTAERITALGSLIGTPDYLAPEQITNARRADIRADIYSLGCTLYVLLTGRPPFPVSSQTQKILAHVDRAAPPIRKLRPEIPEEVALIVEKMLAKDPAARYQTPAEVAKALTPFCVGATLSAALTPPAPLSTPTVVIRKPQSKAKTAIMPVPRRLQKRWLLVAAIPLGLLVLAVVPLGLGVLWWLQRGTPPDEKKDNAVPEKKSDLVHPAPVPKRAPRVLMVLPQKAFWGADYRPVRTVLEEHKVEVKVASSALTDAKPHDPRWGGAVKPDLLLKDARPADFDAVYFAGAIQTEFVGKEPHAAIARQFINDMLTDKKHVAALCRGVIVLAHAGVLNGQSAARTPHVNLREVDEDSIFWDRSTPVVVSGLIVTGGDFIHGPELAKTLAEQLKKN